MRQTGHHRHDRARRCHAQQASGLPRGVQQARRRAGQLARRCRQDGRRHGRNRQRGAAPVSHHRCTHHPDVYLSGQRSRRGEQTGRADHEATQHHRGRGKTRHQLAREDVARRQAHRHRQHDQAGLACAQVLDVLQMQAQHEQRAVIAEIQQEPHAVDRPQRAMPQPGQRHQRRARPAFSQHEQHAGRHRQQRGTPHPRR